MSSAAETDGGVAGTVASTEATLAGRGAGARFPGRLAALVALLALACGCYGFAGGGGLPSHIRTAYVAPVENETSRFGLSEILSARLQAAVQNRMGLQAAAEQDADALVVASVQRYSDEAVSFEGRDAVGADVFQRRVTLTVRVEILDARAQAVLWSSSGVVGMGEYDPEAETEENGLEVALENLVQKIVDGAQSQW